VNPTEHKRGTNTNSGIRCHRKKSLAEQTFLAYHANS
jgi:hypothetical protein